MVGGFVGWLTRVLVCDVRVDAPSIVCRHDLAALPSAAAQQIQTDDVARMDDALVLVG